MYASPKVSSKDKLKEVTDVTCTEKEAKMHQQVILILIHNIKGFIHQLFNSRVNSRIM